MNLALKSRMAWMEPLTLPARMEMMIVTVIPTMTTLM